MKKLFVTVLALAAVGTTAIASSTSAVFLQHDGKITTFEPERINDAMEAAVNGDVIILTEGHFPQFDITKQITVRGVGELSVIDGDIAVNIADAPTLTQNLLEFVNVTGTVKAVSETRGLCLKQCTIKDIVFNAITHDALIDRCHVTHHFYVNDTYETTVTATDGTTNIINSPYVKSLTAVNSVIYTVVGIGDTSINQNTTFINCYLDDINTCGGTVINCIVNSMIWIGSWSFDIWYPVYNTTLINTFYSNEIILHGASFSTGCELINCYTADGYLDYTADMDSLGYWGNDGTIIGPLGGNTPFTLVPAVPKVTNSSLKVNTETQELEVNITVSPN